jgi:hypothetical protein
MLMDKSKRKGVDHWFLHLVFTFSVFYISHMILLCLDQAHSNLHKRESTLIADGNHAAFKVYIRLFLLISQAYMNQ